MSSIYSRPDSDVWQTTDVAWEQSFGSGELRIELWECPVEDGYDDQVWVLVVDPGGHNGKNEHTALTDAMAAMLLRVMRDG